MNGDNDAGREAVDRLLHPRSIALVGASARRETLNGRMLRFLREQGYNGRIYPVNPRYHEIEGLRCYPSLDEVPEPVDLVSILLRADQTLAVVKTAAGRGDRFAMLHASGFAETGDDGARLQERILEAARCGGLRLLGPNMVGLVNAFDGVLATFSQVGNHRVRPGPVALVSQSGAVGTVVNTLARERELGLGFLVTTGNECDVSSLDLVAAVLEDDRIRAVGIYAEGIRSGRRLVALGQRSCDLGKALVMLRAGRGDAGARAARSHTGFLASDRRVEDAALRDAGILRVSDEEDLVDCLEAASRGQAPQGRGAAVISQSGGMGSLVGDYAEEDGLTMPILSAVTQSRLREVLPSFAAVANPVDASMLAVSNPEILEEAFVRMAADDGVHWGMVWIQHMEAQVDLVVETCRRIRERVDIPWTVVWRGAPAEGVAGLREAGIHFQPGARRAVRTAAAMAFLATRRAGAMMSVEPEQPLPHPGSIPDAIGCRSLLASAGIVFNRADSASGPEEAAAAADRIGYPVVLKIDSPEVAHKSEVGGVKPDLTDPESVRDACRKMAAAFHRHCPDSGLRGFVVEEQLPAGVELVVGLRCDRTYGMAVMVGFGGIYTEILNDTVVRLAPVSQIEARSMLEGLRGGAILTGARGRQAVDLDALAGLVSAVSRFGARAQAWLAELDLNPVICVNDQVVAVDAWMELSESGKEQNDD